MTAAAIQTLLGGGIMRCVTPEGSHYWNYIYTDIGRVEVDLTRDQFRVWMPTEVAESNRIRIMSSEDTVRRYEILCDAFTNLADHDQGLAQDLHAALAALNTPT